MNRTDDKEWSEYTDDEKVITMAVHFINCILQNNGDIKVHGLADLYEINNGNTEVLIEHLDAVSSIMQRAIKLLKEK